MSRTYHHISSNRITKNDWVYYHWHQSEPKFWRKLYKHKKRRASQRTALHHVMRGDLDTLFPLDKKPWIYYW